MTEEFVKFLSKKTPLEEKIEALGKTFEKIVYDILEMSESYDKKLLELTKRIEILEVNFNKTEQCFSDSFTKEKLKPPQDNPPSIPPKVTHTQTTPSNLRGDIIRELKEMFEKKR